MNVVCISIFSFTRRIVRKCGIVPFWIMCRLTVPSVLWFCSQKGLINLSWIEGIWRTLRLPAARVTHLAFLREKSRLFRTFFLLAKPINPPLSHYCDERSTLKRIRKYHRFVLPAASLFCQNGKFVCILTRRFVLVLQYPEELAFTMRLVTYIGITISLALLLAAFILFLCLR